MANISLATLRDYWKGVYDWVKGTSSDKPIVKLSDGTDQLAINTDGSINTLPIGSNTLQHGLINIVTSGSPVQLPNFPCREVTIISRRGNTGFVYVGGSSVSTTSFGIELSPKESITLKINNLNLIYIDAAVDGEGVSYITF